MRFSYEPTTGEVSIYVKKEEFDLAAKGDEYRVFTRSFDPENLEKFIESYTEFIKQICNHLMPQEKIQDVLTVSTLKSGYTWRSLLNLDYSDESNSFLENMVSYGLHIIDQEGRIKNPHKTIADYISKKDASKLSLIMTLMNLPSLPEPFKKRKRGKNTKALQKRIDNLNNQIKRFEESYGFSSETMYKYYQDDELPDDNMGSWINAYNELKFINSVKNRETIVEELLEVWDKKQ